MFVIHTALKLILAGVIMLASTALWADNIEFEGLIEPYVVVEVGTPVEGLIDKITVDRSSVVEKGQVLVYLESSVEMALLKKAQAVASFDGELGVQQTRLAFAKRFQDRIDSLSSISLHDKDQAMTDIVLNENRLKIAMENRSLAKLEMKKAEAVLARRSIRSPIAGVVVERYVSPGEFVDDQPLLQVAQIDPLLVEVIVPAQMFGRIRTGMPAYITPEIEAYGEQTAHVSIVDKIIDPASSTFGVWLELPNPGKRIPSGLKCRVIFPMNESAELVKTATAQTNFDDTHRIDPE